MASPVSLGSPVIRGLCARTVRRSIRQTEALPAFGRGLLAENPRWTDADASLAVVGIASCDTEALAASCERGLEYNTLQLVRALRVPGLLMLARLDTGSVLLEPERSEVIAALSRDDVIELASGHVLHRDQFDECVSLALRFLQADAVQHSAP